MAGHVRRRGPGRWQVRYYDPSGEERTKTFDRKVDADRFLSSVQVQLAQGDWADPRLGRTTFKEWSEEWLRTTVHYKPKTRAGIESLLKIHLLPAFGSHPLGRITQMHVRSWVAEASGRMSAARLRQAYWLLSKVLGTAVEVGYLAKTPCIGVKLPRIPKREMRFLTADQVMALAQAVDPRYRTMVLVLVYGGLRWGECCALRRKRVDVLRGRLEVAESLAEIGGHLYFGETKTYRRRNVTLPGFLRTLLAEQLNMTGADPDALVFTAPEGGPLRAENFRGRVWMPALAAAGIPAGLRVHDLRHTCAALLIANRAQAKEVQEHLGHSSITVTFDRYGHLFPENLDRLADGLEETFRRSETVWRRSEGNAEVIKLPVSEEKLASDQGK